jgi:hypothetical protein
VNGRTGRIVGGSLGLAAVAAVAAAAGGPAATQAADREQSTQLISRALDGGLPNGPSTHAVISNDKRYSRAIAFESDASNLVQGDLNGQRDVFAVLRTGSIGNDGSAWEPGRTVLMSRGMGGQPANGPSAAPTIDGGFHSRPTCVGFLSAASNLAAGDTNGKVDAFVSKLRGGAVKRVSRPGGRQATADTTAVAVSSDCKQVAFVTDGKLYVSKKGRRARRVGPAGAADPAFSTGVKNDLVFGAPRGVYLAKGGSRRPRLVAPGGRNPAYNDLKRQVVTYEKTVNGRSQIGYHDIGKRERIISSRNGSMGDGGSRNPVIGNAGYYVTFESDASNLGVNALNRVGDGNGRPDAYLFTDVRDLTLVQSVKEKSVPVPGGGQNPSMSFYANYIVFDSPAPLDSANGPHQIYMRYLGPV